MRNISFRPRAQLDLESMYLHRAVVLAEPQAAQSLVDAIYEALERIADMPTLGMLFDADDLERKYYRTLVKSHWIYYTFDSESVTVWRIFHARQDIDTYSIVVF